MGAGGEFSIDRVPHRLGVLQNLVVREADDPDPILKQRSAAILVVLPGLLVVMLAPVGLDAQAGGETTKVDDVPCDWNLPAEMMTVKSATPQQGPESSFGFGGGFAHLPREGDQASAVVALSGHRNDILAMRHPACQNSPSPTLPRSTGGGGRCGEMDRI